MSDGSTSLVVFGRVPSRLKRRTVREAAARLRAEVAQGREFVVLITGDEELRRLNRTFRNKDETTDVLSFPTAEGAMEWGEIAISAGRAKEQAEARGHELEQEITILMLHGLLHLMGFDHETDRGEMKRAESKWRRKLNLPTGLIERAGRA